MTTRIHAIIFAITSILALALIGAILYSDYLSRKRREKLIMECAKVNQEIAKRLRELIDG